MDGVGHHGRRPRPVADAPALDAADVAKGWLLALVADAPLAAAGAVPAAELARGGPALCGGVLAALASDAELERLVAGDGRAPLGASAARLTGARTPGALMAGVEALRAVTWRALRAELRDPVPELIADLADRLSYVCARVVEVSLTAGMGAEAPGRGGGPLAEALASTGVVPQPGGRVPGAEDFAGPVPGGRGGADPFGGDDPLAEAARRAAARFGAQTEHDEPMAPPPAGVNVVDMPAAPDSADPLSSLAEELAAAPPPPLDDALYAPAPDAPTVTRLHPVDTTWEDQKDVGPPWLAAIARRLERREQDGRPFAVFVVEIDDLERLLSAQTGREVAIALETAERGLTAELAPADLVIRERLGRWWLTSPDRDTTTARDLGTRVATAIAHAELGGAPLSASIGLAVCPSDADTLETLAGRADEAMFAARAAGVPLA
ncbi:MAG TPA: diguanylate cyclase [Baekduia sp.]